MRLRFSPFLSLLIIVESVNSHSSNFHSHARRSLDIIKRQGLLGGLGKDLGLGGNPSSQAPTTTASSASDSSSSTTTSTHPPVSSTNSGGDLLGGVVGGLGGVLGGQPTTPSSSPTGSPTITSSITASPSSGSGGLGNVVGGLLNPVVGAVTPVVKPVVSALTPVVNPVVSALTPVVNPVVSALTPVVNPVVSALTPVVNPVASALTPVVNPVVSALTPVVNPVASALTPVVNPVVSALTPVVNPVVSALTPVVNPVVSALTPVVNPVLSAVSPALSPVLGAATAVASPILGPGGISSTGSLTAPSSVTTSSSSDSGGLGGIVGSLLSPVVSAGASILGPGPTGSPTTTTSGDVVGGLLSSVVSVGGSIITGVVPAVTSIISQGAAPLFTSIPPPPSSASPTIIPSINTPLIISASTNVLSTSVSNNPSSIPIISFPHASSTPVTTPNINSVTSASKTSTVAIDPSIAFILSVPSLAVTLMPTSSVANSITNPDQATTTASATILVPPTMLPLPSGLPARLYPHNQLDPSTIPTGYTFIGILFDLDLDWVFVTGSSVSSTQIFAYVPMIIGSALSISGSQILTYALQVYIPTSYHTPVDANQLGTMWLGYIPSDHVGPLAQQILAKQSKFYTGGSDKVALALASHVDSGFSIRSVSDPNSGNEGSTKGPGNGSKSRQDAIIGVVSSLAAIALLVLVFLVYRMMKRRRELAHRRLSDPPDAVGVRPEGRDFDQDSVGGARRRSFYYAEDSLRGFQGERDDESAPIAGAGPSMMTQRKTVIPGTQISAPILRESSLNW